MHVDSFSDVNCIGTAAYAESGAFRTDCDLVNMYFDWHLDFVSEELNPPPEFMSL
jgi:hypothetical protein